MYLLRYTGMRWNDFFFFLVYGIYENRNEFRFLRSSPAFIRTRYDGNCLNVCSPFYFLILSFTFLQPRIHRTTLQRERKSNERTDFIVCTFGWVRLCRCNKVCTSLSVVSILSWATLRGTRTWTIFLSSFDAQNMQSYRVYKTILSRAQSTSILSNYPKTTNRHSDDEDDDTDSDGNDVAVAPIATAAIFVYCKWKQLSLNEANLSLTPIWCVSLYDTSNWIVSNTEHTTHTAKMRSTKSIVISFQRWSVHVW